MIDIPNELEAQALISRGVSDEALLCLRAGRVRFLDGGTFEFADDGQRALVFRVLECGCEIDRVAWSHKDSRLATWRGVAFALGQAAIWNPATYFAAGALHAHRTPLDWLKADRDGICVVNPRMAYSQLRHVPRLIVEDVEHGRKLRGWLRSPKSTTEILVKVRAAA